METEKTLKKVGIGILTCAITILAFKFFIWNFWKLEWTEDFFKGVMDAPAAVNLTISQRDNLIFKKSFPRNKNGNFFIINQFDISPYIRVLPDLVVSIDNNPTRSLKLTRYDTFYILAAQNYYFVFTTPECGIKDFLVLKKNIVSIINNFLKSTVKRGEKET